MLSRRVFFTFAVGIIAAPAIVKVSALMPLRGELIVPEPLISEADIFDFATEGMDAEGYDAHFADMARGKGMIAARRPGRESPWMKHAKEIHIDPWPAYFHGGSITVAPEMVYR